MLRRFDPLTRRARPGRLGEGPGGLAVSSALDGPAAALFADRTSGSAADRAQASPPTIRAAALTMTMAGSRLRMS